MLLTSAILLLLVFAAWRDLLTRTIPDVVSLLILAIGLVVRIAGGYETAGISLLVALGLFLLLLPLHARGLMGGADLKLLSALAAGLNPLDSYYLVCWTALLGGVLAVLYLALRQVLRRYEPRSHTRRAFSVQRFFAVELWRIRKGAALPYGVAIAASAAICVLGPSGV